MSVTGSDGSLPGTPSPVQIADWACDLAEALLAVVVADDGPVPQTQRPGAVRENVLTAIAGSNGTVAGGMEKLRDFFQSAPMPFGCDLAARGAAAAAGLAHALQVGATRDNLLLVALEIGAGLGRQAAREALVGEAAGRETGDSGGSLGHTGLYVAPQGGGFYSWQ